jgi:translocation and assembly module TamA
MFLLLIGCVARQQGDALSSVTFELTTPRPQPWYDVTRPNNRALKNAMAHEQPTFQSFVAPGWIEPAWLDRDTLDTDGWRIEVWYANHGYFDAHFRGWRLLTRAPTSARLRGVRAVGMIDEGLPSRVRSIRVQGVEKLGRPLQRRIERLHTKGPSAEVAVGDIYAREDWDTLKDAISELLQDRSYAQVEVAGRASVYPEEHAVDLVLDVKTGPASRFGAVTFDGLVKVPEAVLRDLLEVEPGEPYSNKDLEKTRSKLYALRVFSVVDILPQTTPGDPTVPVVIRVVEGKFKQISAGPIIEFEPGVSSAAFRAEWEDNNVAGRLWRMKQDTMVGAGVVLAPLAWEKNVGFNNPFEDIGWSDIKPIASITGTVELPHLLHPSLSLLNAGKVEVGIEPYQYRFFSPAFTPSLVWSGFEKLTISAGYRLEYTDYFEVVTLGTREFELDFKDPDLLSALEQRLVYDGRNDVLNTTRGWYWTIGLTEAGGPFGGSWQFLRATGEVRAWRGIVELGNWQPDIVFAGRLGGGIAAPYGEGEEAAISLKEKLYLGGSNSVRGWSANRLGPYACRQEQDGVRPNINESDCQDDLTRQLPIGGELQLYGNLEMRKGLPWGLTAATFLDIGQVWAKPADFDAAMLQFSLGAGIRYATPVGPIRLDVARRLGGWQQTEEQLARFGVHSLWGVHLSLSEAF